MSGTSPQRAPRLPPTPAPEVFYPGRCYCCGAMGVVAQYWPSGLYGWFTEVCRACLDLGDEEVARIVIGKAFPGGRRPNGAVI